MAAMYVWSLAAVLFSVELAMVAVITAAAWQAAGGGVPGWLAALAAASAVVAVWALAASPSPIVDSGIGKLVVKVALFAAAALLLRSTMHRPDLALWFAAVALVINLAAILPPYRDYGGFDVPA